MPFKNIIVFGAGGIAIGPYLVKALAEDGSFHTTVLARHSSKTTYPDSVDVIRVSDDYPFAELVEAVRGQDVVIAAINLSIHDVQYRLIDACIEAGVKRYIPAEWGMDNADPNNQWLNPIFKMKSEIAEYLKSKESERFCWTAVACSIWLDFALGLNVLSMDPVNHTAELWRDGTHRFTATTLPYVATATVEVLKRPDLGRNQRVFLSPFETSQLEVIAELEKQQGLKYNTTPVDDVGEIRKCQETWEKEKDPQAAYRLVIAGVLLPEYKSGFTSAGKEPILEELIEMPKLTIDDVVRETLRQMSSADS